MLVAEGWEYRNIQGNEERLQANTEKLLAKVDSMDEQEASNIRRLHETLFEGLAPSGRPYFAGNYRGSQHPDLLNYELNGDIFAHPTAVAGQMHQFTQELCTTLQNVAALHSSSDSNAVKRLHAAKASARVFTKFIRIHPFANGNGHIARLLVCIIMAKAGFYLSSWVEPRPEPIDLYNAASISAVNRNDLQQLVALIFNAPCFTPSHLP